jgi:predicted nucleotidyltransferase
MPGPLRPEEEMFDTHILDAAETRRAARLEAERRIILESVARTLRSAAPAMGIVEAFVVGSLITAAAWTEDSDVDVAISGGDVLEVMKVVEDSAGRPVDVIDLDRHPASDLIRRRGWRVVG